MAGVVITAGGRRGWGLAERAPGVWVAVNSTRLALLRRVAFGGAVCKGPADRPFVALTFDDGPDDTATPAILRALDAAGARATFFVLGRSLEARPELARRMAERHELGTHLYSHDRATCRSPARFHEEAARSLGLHEQVLGRRPAALRFPFGAPGRVTPADVRRWGLTAYHWTFSSEDSSAASGDDVVAHVLPRLHAGAIVLLHDGRGPHSTKPSLGRQATVDALPHLLRGIAERGLTAVSLEQMFG